MGHGTSTLVTVLGHDVNIYYTEIVFFVCVLFTRSRINERRPTTRTTVMEMSSCCLCPGQHLTSTSTGDVSGLVASGAVYFGQLVRRSRRASAYVTTRAFVGPVYVTIGSIRAVQWSRSRDLSACGRTLARWAIELWSISHDLGEDYKSKRSTWRGEK